MRTKNIICRAHIQAVTDVLKSWKKDHDEAMKVRDLEDLIRLCLAFCEEEDQLVTEALETLASDKTMTVRRHGFMIQATLDAAVQAVEAVTMRVEHYKRQGYSVDNEETLREVARKTRQRQVAFLGQWPFFTLEELEESSAVIERGEFVTGEDLLRELQGEGGTAR